MLSLFPSTPPPPFPAITTRLVASLPVFSTHKMVTFLLSFLCFRGGEGRGMGGGCLETSLSPSVTSARTEKSKPTPTRPFLLPPPLCKRRTQREPKKKTNQPTKPPEEEGHKHLLLCAKQQTKPPLSIYDFFIISLHIDIQRNNDNPTHLSFLSLPLAALAERITRAVCAAAGYPLSARGSYTKNTQTPPPPRRVNIQDV